MDAPVLETHHGRRRGLRRALLGHPLYWGCQLAGWSGFWALFMVIFFSGSSRQPPPALLFQQTFFCVGGLVATHLIRILFHWFDWYRLTIFSIVPRIVFAALLCGVIQVWCAQQLLASLSGQRPIPQTDAAPSDEEAPPQASFLQPISLRTFFEYVQFVMTLMAWSAIYLGYQYQQQLRLAQLDRLRLDGAIREAELKALRGQVNPHFLFNSLNTIRALIDENPGKAREAVSRLSELFRASLRTSEAKTVALGVELQTVEAYLALQKLRFEDRLTVGFQLDGKLRDWPVPPFLLQTLVENAFKHGVYPRTGGGMIRCRISQAGEGIHISVINPGQLVSGTDFSGSGLANARARLELLYGSSAYLRLFQSAADLICAEVFLPSRNLEL